jgi:hypothetical protein
MHDVPARDHHNRREHTNDRKKKEKEIHAHLSLTLYLGENRATLA